MRPATRSSKRASDTTTRASLCTLRFRFHAPELKTLIFDRLLDLPARELVGRIPVGRDRADCVPRPKLARQLASIQIAGERAKILVRPRFENKNSHGASANSRRSHKLGLADRSRVNDPAAVVGLNETEASRLIVKLYCARYHATSPRRTVCSRNRNACLRRFPRRFWRASETCPAVRGESAQ